MAAGVLHAPHHRLKVLEQCIHAGRHLRHFMTTENRDTTGEIERLPDLLGRLLHQRDLARNLPGSQGHDNAANDEADHDQREQQGARFGVGRLRVLNLPPHMLEFAFLQRADEFVETVVGCPVLALDGGVDSFSGFRVGLVKALERGVVGGAKIGVVLDQLLELGDRLGFVRVVFLFERFERFL